MSCADTRVRLARPTVARPDFPSGWLLMDHPEQGYRSLGYPFAALADIATTFAVIFGEAGRDAHGDFVRVEPAPEYTPTSDEIEAARWRAWQAKDAADLPDVAHVAAVANLAAWKLLLGVRTGAAALRTQRADPPARALGEVLGSLDYLGSCPECGRQFHSRHTLVLVVGHATYCTGCKEAAVAARTRRRA
jgi:hypothetical protein